QEGELLSLGDFEGHEAADRLVRSDEIPQPKKKLRREQSATKTSATTPRRHLREALARGPGASAIGTIGVRKRQIARHSLRPNWYHSPPRGETSALPDKSRCPSGSGASASADGHLFVNPKGRCRAAGDVEGRLGSFARARAHASAERRVLDERSDAPRELRDVADGYEEAGLARLDHFAAASPVVGHCRQAARRRFDQRSRQSFPQTARQHKDVQRGVELVHALDLT